MTARPVRPLAEVLRYRNAKVIWRFQEKFDVTTREAKDLFRETLRWMWACARSREVGGPALSIRSSLVFLDEMWHEFILFTHDYVTFCNAYLGGYIHHAPATRPEKRAFQRLRARDPARLLAQEEAAVREQLTFLHDHLGARALEKWVRVYKAKYTTAFMNERRRPF